MWLLIRVSTQLVISRSSGSQDLYRGIMVFIMSYILKSATSHEFAPDLIYTMTAKIDRRLRKLSGAGNPVLPQAVMASIDNILQQSFDFLAKTWDTCQQLDSRDLQLSRLSALDFEQDTMVALPKLDDYIKGTRTRQPENNSAGFMPSSRLMKLELGFLPSLPDRHFNDVYAAANLSQFEHWVAHHIDDWLTANTRETVCQKLHNLMIQYHDLAQVRYSGNPEATSVMVLTMFELWVACDKAAIQQCPLLSEYDPGIPTDALQNLLLPLLDQMKRLLQIEEYIDCRRIGSMKRTDLLFATSDSSFASQYFARSSTHQELMSRIVSDAKAARKKKLEELEKVQAEYHRLDVLDNEIDHEYTTKVINNRSVPPRTKEVHSHKCQKCIYQNQRQELSIEVHEWPLPSRSSEAYTVVFELDTPLWFANWRDARLVLLKDVLKGQRTKDQDSRRRFFLSSNDPHLLKWRSNRSSDQRMDLMSLNKAAITTHYRSKTIATLSESEIFVPNGLFYNYYDKRSNEYPGEYTFKNVVPLACTYTMPCQHLQRFLFRPASAPDGPDPNVVIASQDACPANMTLEEYKEFGILPLGHHIQWANIKLQLAMPSLDFKKPETTLLLLQCAYQAGPRLAETCTSAVSRNEGQKALRSSHDFFNSEENAQSLIKHLMEALQRVKSNWESSQALLVFVAIAARTLSLSGFVKVRMDCLEFLSIARQIAMSWLNSLRDKAYAAEDHNDKTAFTAKSVEVALICTSTFDIDGKYLNHVLAGKGNASILVQASIVIREGEDTLASEKEPHLAILAMRRKRLLCRAYEILAQHPTELDDAVKKAWSAYVPGSGWRAVLEAADHWVTTNTLATSHVASMSVHYNLLSGELLVNGLLLDQPPPAYRAHSQYSTLFGKNVVEIMPSTTPGFQFSTKRQFGGFSVQLGMSNGDLVVRASTGDTTYETIPRRLVENAYPASFGENYIHWFNAATNTVQFRPVEKPWDSSSPEVWTLSQCRGQWRRGQWRLSKNGYSVAGVDSLTSKRISLVLDPLASRTRIHNILQPAGDVKTLLVSIPKLRLTFSLVQGSESLESNQYRSMVVDADQSLGTLIGLRSKIVLKHSTRDDRMALVPESKEVTYQRAGNHISVAVDKRKIHKVHALCVDPKLGRLLDNSELGCKLFLAYLHALTSFCLVDPLTHKTGTEQALTILKSAAVRSFDQLAQEHIDRLGEIAALSPGRCYYPTHLRVMQTVDWDNTISFLSQHGDFITTVETLLGQAKQRMTFFPDTKLSFPRLEEPDEHLLQRDNIRSATFRVSGFGAEDHTTQSDKQYTARDRHQTSRRATRASTISRLIFRDGLALFQPAPTTNSLFKLMCTFDTVHFGLDPAIAVSSLKYDGSLFEDGYWKVLRRLPAFHRCLATPTAWKEYKFSIMMWLSTIASHKDADLFLLQLVAMFLKSAALAQIRAPGEGPFRPKLGYFSEAAIKRVFKEYLLPFSSCPEWILEREDDETPGGYRSRCDSDWQVARKSAIETFLDRLTDQWPCKNPSRPLIMSSYIRVNDAMPTFRSLFPGWYDNIPLQQYFDSIEQAMSGFDHEPIEPVRLTISAPPRRLGISGYVSEHGSFSLPAPYIPWDCHTFDNTFKYSTQKHGHRGSLRLESVIKRLESRPGRSKYDTQYVEDLRESLDALVYRDGDEAPSATVNAEALKSHLKSCTEHVNEVYGLLEAAITVPLASSSSIRSTYHRPRVSPIFFLQQLSRSRWHHLSDRWKACIVRYALALAAMQRAERLTRLTERQDLVNELLNLGHQNWDPAKHPESLLMEVESGFLIRPVQTQVAQQMQDPPEGNNAVMQLNMGEGKSSVIVPIVAAALADGKQLLRVVVAKPQSKQMAQMLMSKLGGLLDRRVFYMPISRSLKLDTTGAENISDMLHECMSSGGVLLIQPEHILSFQLMVLECYTLGRESVGREILSTLDFLEQNARDIVDESDENFNVRFELIYTMGMQRPIELSPDRWLILQEVLGLVRMLAPGIAKDLPVSVEYQPGVHGCFPRIRILRQDAGRLLNQRLADHICNNGLHALQISRQPEEMRNAVYIYITKAQLSLSEINAVEKSLFWTEATKLPLLLIRGIIACGVLEFVLAQKRWRVNYGLASRTPPTQLAVPYRAKDSPSLRSEFSHPDVVITLTSLSYYYGGLSDDDLFVAIGCLMEADQSEVEYQAWVRDASNLPTEFKQLQGINLKDRQLCTSNLFPALRSAKSVIDFFLAHIVFPKQMKEFPHKLSASGWDIGKRKNQPVTGFSGTNDSRCLLPTDVHQLDHPDQKHTNALVLEHILQPENGVELMTPVTQHTSDADHLLATVLQLTPSVQVILDVGAQILELTNIEVAKNWLVKHDATKEAAVFVNDDDELCVIDREGRVDLLRASSFSTRLDSCLIFLDEAHTRGIDLRLPSDYRAAVTLGASLTKDRLVQACMRMRKLGKGQTVVFCISQEIQAKITEYKGLESYKATGTDITIEDVILWSISETHVELRRSMPLWTVQGERFFRQNRLWRVAYGNGRTLMSKQHAERFQEKEAKSLDDRFRPRQGQSQAPFLANTSNPDLLRIAERCKQFDELQFNGSTLQEEQERELSPEIEQERQVQKVPAAKPAQHRLHEDVRRFAIYGEFIRDSAAYMPAFEALKDSSAARNFSVHQLGYGQGNLFVTADFAKTIVPPTRSAYISDAFQMPVQWVLTNRVNEATTMDCIIIVISPYEANQLYKHMESSNTAALYVFKARCNSGYAPLDRLDFHTVTAMDEPPVLPRGLVMQLALFSGQLYISSFGDYKEICGFLGLSTQAVTQEMSEQGWKVAADGFILSDERGRSGGGEIAPYKSPVGFFKILMSKIRRNGDGIAKTHMGSLLEGKLFRPSDFEE